MHVITRKIHQDAMLLQYVLKRSARAKHVHLKVTAHRGLEVTIPRGFNAERVPGILREKSTWITRALQRAEDEKRLLPASVAAQLPEEVNLRALQKKWKVTYDGEESGFREMEDTLVVSGAGQEMRKEALRAWVRTKAQVHMVPWLRAISHELDIPFGKVQIRNQRTRWASCSGNKTISINKKMLFLSPDLVRYVFIHELCHTIELNHSSDFWRLVEENDPGYLEAENALRTAVNLVPVWMNV